MLVYLGFDDTDDADAVMGTGRLAREFAHSLGNGFKVRGIVRHQLPRLADIPYTSNNSSACILVEASPDASLDALRDQAATHIASYCAPGSDPGLCVAEDSMVDAGIVDLAKNATAVRLTQQAAMDAAGSVRLHGLGGSNDGIIGAAAAVGLTCYGWCGRFIEYGALRDLPATLRVQDLHQAGIEVVSVDRDPLVPLNEHKILGAAWLRPSLWAGRPVLQVKMVSHGVWEPAHGKRKKAHAAQVQTS